MQTQQPWIIVVTPQEDQNSDTVLDTLNDLKQLGYDVRTIPLPHYPNPLQVQSAGNARFKRIQGL